MKRLPHDSLPLDEFFRKKSLSLKYLSLSLKYLSLSLSVVLLFCSGCSGV